jgi:hypothetical protein
MAALAAPAAAQLTPAGPDFAVNAAPLHAHTGPELALSTAGDLLAVWTVDVAPEYSEVWARAFDAAGQPLGPGRRIDTGNLLKVGAVPVALADGRFAVAWTNIVPPAASPAALPTGGAGTVSVRLLDRTGETADGEQRIDTAGVTDGGLRIAPLAAGFVVAWSELYSLLGQSRIAARRLTASGNLVGNEIDIDGSAVCNLSIRGLGGLADGGFSVFWQTGDDTQPGCAGTRARRYDATGQPTVPIFPVPPADLFAVRGDGGYLAVSSRLPPPELPVASGYDVYVRLFDANGVALAPEQLVNTGLPGEQRATAAVAGGDEGFLVAWSDEDPGDDDFVDAGVFARLVDRAGTPSGPAFSLSAGSAGSAGDQLGPHIATDGHGHWAAGWVNEGPGTSGGDLFARRFSADAPCLAAICLHGDRFGLAVSWRDPRSGRTGIGTPVTLNDGSAAFWFFDAANVELFVKVLDGRPVNGHWWVFYGSLSDVEYTLTVTDSRTGAVKSYRNPPFTLASHADTEAFAEAAQAARMLPAAAPAAVKSGPGLEPCVAGPQTLCLRTSSFAVDVAWRDPRTGDTGVGQAVALSGDSGYFWFFAADNVELVVKVLDGRAVNGRFWVFYASLTDVEYTITVRNSLSGTTKTYHNPPFTLASRADTSAF